MAEYLIRTVSGEDWPSFAQDHAEILVPVGYACEPIDGWGDFRMRCGDVEVSFSGEEVGWQVSVGGAMADATADSLIETITRLIEAVTEPCEWLRIG